MRVDGYTDTLDAVVVALCADYERRRSAILQDKAERRTLMEYRYINSRIYEAVAETVGERLCPVFIKEIGQRIGYAKSEIDCMSESSYKSEKQLAKIKIARALRLID